VQREKGGYRKRWGYLRPSSSNY